MNIQPRLLIILLLLPWAGVQARADGPEASPAAIESIAEAAAQPEPETEPEADPTVIDSDRLEMVSEEEETRFIFSGNVSVTGNNLVVLCDRLEVTTARFEENETTETPPPAAEPVAPGEIGQTQSEVPSPPENPEAAVPSGAPVGDPAGLGRLRVIVATGNVRITQDGREATAGRAELRPREGLIILTENPVFRDAQGTVSGPRIILDQNRNEAIVEGTTEQRARVTLPSLPDFSPGGSRSRTQENPPREP